MVRIKVSEGDDQKCFEVHKGVISFYSGYFERALKGSFIEAQKGEVTLPTEDPAVFDLFQYWLYTKRFLPDMTAEEPGELDWNVLCGLWVFGDAHEIPLLQNTVADKLVEKMINTDIVPINEITFIYDDTTEGSQLRALVIDLIGKTGDSAHIVASKYMLYWSKESTFDLLKVVWKSKAQPLTNGEVKKWDSANTMCMRRAQGTTAMRDAPLSSGVGCLPGMW